VVERAVPFETCVGSPFSVPAAKLASDILDKQESDQGVKDGFP
jgi:hypothetical protein